jgi:hypothetical protein
MDRRTALEPEGYVEQGCCENELAGLREEFSRLARHYAQLRLSPSAKTLREHDPLNARLMQLYVALHPGTAFRVYDDFDVVARVLRRRRGAHASSAGAA